MEEQRGQLQEQEKQVALLRARIALLEGTNDPKIAKPGVSADSVDDFSIRVSPSERYRVSETMFTPQLVELCFTAREADQRMGRFHRKPPTSGSHRNSSSSSPGRLRWLPTRT